jgi:hypothetical protein
LSELVYQSRFIYEKKILKKQHVIARNKLLVDLLVLPRKSLMGVLPASIPISDVRRREFPITVPQTILPISSLPHESAIPAFTPSIDPVFLFLGWPGPLRKFFVSKLASIDFES